jgi:murein L,D-transpeptidase YcbB/YkuD
MLNRSVELDNLDNNRVEIKKNNETERMKFRNAVQYEVMKILGYFTDDFEKIKDDNKRMMESNEIFMRWVNDQKAAQFAKCFADIVPAGIDRPFSDVNIVATSVAIEMGAELKH